MQGRTLATARTYLAAGQATVRTPGEHRNGRRSPPGAGTARPCLPGTPRPRLAGERSTSILGKHAGTKQESDELWLQDLIACGTRRETQESVYVGIEVAMVIATRMNESTKKRIGR